MTDWQERLRLLAMAQVGKPYRWASEVSLDCLDPTCFDCAELTQWLLYQAMPKDYKKYLLDFDPSSKQFFESVPIIGLPSCGDLGFKHRPITHTIHHVGMVLSEDLMVEAKGRFWGVVETPLRSFVESSHFCGFRRPRFLASLYAKG